MKHLLFYTLIIFFIGLVGCNKKELEDNRAEIIGTWVANFETLSGCTDPGMDVQGEITCSDEACVTYTFEEDGTYFAEFTIDRDNFGEQGTYSLGDDDITLCIEDDGESICNGGGYDVGAVSLTFSIIDPETGCTVFRIFERAESDL